MSRSIVLAAAASGGRITPATPTLAYAGSGTNDNGKFTITNYDPSFVYTATGGTVSGNILTVTNPSSSATLTARTPKGLAASSGRTATRLAASTSQYYTQTGPFQCYYSGSCASQCGGCGTYYSQDQWNPNDGSPAGFYACCDQGYWTTYYVNQAGSGYTWSGADYTNGQGEWWKIT